MLDRPGQQRSSLAWAVAALTLALTTACSEPPSYTVGWKLVDEAALADPDLADDLVSVKQCSDVGVSRVRITTSRPDTSVADRSEFPCYPGDGVELPALPPGEYSVLVEGLRRTGEPWECVIDPEVVNPDPCVAIAEASVTIAEGALPSIEVLLLRPPECDDGIDNDRDGRVDGKDPGCLISTPGVTLRDRREADEAGRILVEVAVSFLGSPAVKPANVGVRGFELAIDGELLAEVDASELDTDVSPFRLPLLSSDPDVDYEAGEHEFSIVAVDAGGAPLTTTKQQTFPVGDSGGGFVTAQFDFAAEDFFAPIVEPFAVNIGLLHQPGDASGPPCSLAGSLASIERVRFLVTDEDAMALDAATLALTTSSGVVMAVDEPGGWVSFACPSATVRSAELLWGDYDVEIDARIGDVACFSTSEPRDLAPVGGAGAQNLYLERILVDGAPPPGCEECANDDDCAGQVCEAGLCKDISP